MDDERNLPTFLKGRPMKFKWEGHFIRLLGEQVWYKGKCVSLSHRPKILELVRIFFNAPTKPRSLHEILQEICHHQKLNELSERYQKSLKAKVLKNIQRCRNILNESFLSLNVHSKWLRHDRKSKTWLLISQTREKLEDGKNTEA